MRPPDRALGFGARAVTRVGALSRQATTDCQTMKMIIRLVVTDGGGAYPASHKDDVRVLRDAVLSYPAQLASLEAVSRR